MAVIHTWQPNESCDLVIRHLVEGKCVALPTESTYEIVASVLHLEAGASMHRFEAAEQIPAIILGDYANLFDWLPLLAGAAPRLFRKMGPGPLTLSADGGFSYGIWPRLPEESRRLVIREGRIAVRWPAHAIWDELRPIGLPLVSVPVKGATNAEVTAQLTGADCASIIDAGPTQYGAVPSFLQAADRRCCLLREGGLSREKIEQLALCRILFICTGNTCRSPMAEVLCAKLLADQLGCSPSELNQKGFYVQSAGLAAMMGAEASPDAVRVAADFGADLSGHRSRTASMEMLLWADHTFAMTGSHLYSLAGIANIPEPRLLSPAGEDIPDPISGELADYRTCAEQIIQCLKQRLPELLES